MSKYTEAEAKIKKIMCEEIDRLPSHFDGEDEVYDSTKNVDEILKLNKTVCKALEIADRLERADAVDVHNFYCTKFYKKCYFKDGCTESGYKCKEAVAWENGYNQALSDVRGDAE